MRGPIARAPILRSASLVPTTTVCGPVFENAREGRARRVGHAACRRESLSLAVALWAVAMRGNTAFRVIVGDIFLRSIDQGQKRILKQKAVPCIFLHTLSIHGVYWLNCPRPSL